MKRLQLCGNAAEYRATWAGALIHLCSTHATIARRNAAGMGLSLPLVNVDPEKYLCASLIYPPPPEPEAAGPRVIQCGGQGEWAVHWLGTIMHLCDTHKQSAELVGSLWGVPVLALPADHPLGPCCVTDERLPL